MKVNEKMLFIFHDIMHLCTDQIIMDNSSEFSLWGFESYATLFVQLKSSQFETKTTGSDLISTNWSTLPSKYASTARISWIPINLVIEFQKPMNNWYHTWPHYIDVVIRDNSSIHIEKDKRQKHRTSIVSLIIIVQFMH